MAVDECDRSAAKLGLACPGGTHRSMIAPKRLREQPLARGWCNTPMDDLVVWIQGLFDDCSCRAPSFIGWDLDRAEPPVTATVGPVECSSAQIVLNRDDVLERINFAARLQAFLDVELDQPVPPCPAHRVGLAPVRVRDAVHWHCEAGDFRCCVGGYQDALWPRS
jgi:hypothetical protein